MRGQKHDSVASSSMEIFATRLKQLPASEQQLDATGSTGAQPQSRQLLRVRRAKRHHPLKCHRKLVTATTLAKTSTTTTTTADTTTTTTTTNSATCQLGETTRRVRQLALLCVATISLIRFATCGAGAERMVRLCIASVDPVKLSSQCVMCNRREFPLTVIDCTGITKVNDLIANPLSVQEATCLIYNCRRQVPDVKPERYHGSVSHAANYRGSASTLPSGYSGPVGSSMGPMGPSGSRLYEMMTPSGMLGGGYPMGGMPSYSPFASRYGSYGSYAQASGDAGATYSPTGPYTPKGLIGGPSFMSDRQRGPLPYALVMSPPAFPFGRNKYKMALMPLFR